MKKCLVLDLDNTLWGGIIGEDGIENIALALTPPGNSFVAFQQAILDHYDRGVILAINSRNNPEEAWAVIRNHPNMILKEKNFAASRINWKDKSENMRELAAELNIGLDSMVFLDDDPTQRSLVRELLPEVLVPDFPSDPKDYTSFLNALGCFETKVITDEDKMRGNLYVTERLRKEEEKNAVSKSEFLQGLKLELTVYENNISFLPRLAQLTEKTNQFNIDKRPLSEKTLKSYLKDKKHHIFCARLQDRFGDHGIIALAIAEEKGPSRWHLSTFLMSCRVLGRNVEGAFLSAICKKAALLNIKEISIAFKKSPKNVPAEKFVKKHFGKGNKFIKLKTRSPKHIKIIYG